METFRGGSYQLNNGWTSKGVECADNDGPASVRAEGVRDDKSVSDSMIFARWLGEG